MRASAPRRPVLAAAVGLVPLLVTVTAQAPAPARPADPAQAVQPAAVTHTPAVSRDLARPRFAAASVEGWTGFAFDACRAPSQRTMDRWRTHSPFLGVGIYIGGALRACSQPNLTPRWVGRQLRTGWKLLPLWVGPQASCTGFSRRISSGRGARGLYPGARRQGIRAARGAVAAARALRIPASTTLWYDIEPFSTRSERCRRSALRFLSSWTIELHRRGYRSGVYSTVNAAVDALAHAPGGPRGYASPDHVWFAWVNHRVDSWLGGPGYVNRPGWKMHRRVHQFALDVTARYGGVRLAIDQSYVDLGQPKTERRQPGPCGPTADLRWFPEVDPAASGRHGEAARCLLRFAGYRPAPETSDLSAVMDGGTADRTVTTAALRTFQRSRRLPATGQVEASTWTALLATGTRPVLKRGSAGPPVRRVQRALNAALPGAIPVTGVFGTRTAARVRTYQARVGLPVTGVVATRTWTSLAHGVLRAPHRVHPHRAGHHHAHRAAKHGHRHLHEHVRKHGHKHVRKHGHVGQRGHARGHQGKHRVVHHVRHLRHGAHVVGKARHQLRRGVHLRLLRHPRLAR